VFILIIEIRAETLGLLQVFFSIDLDKILFQVLYHRLESKYYEKNNFAANLCYFMLLIKFYAI
jgi:hypothetical protein